MDFSAFPRFTSADDPEEAVKQIEALRNVPTAWMKETPEVTRLDDFSVSPDKGRYIVDVDDVPFECLYFPSEHRRLYVMLSAGRMLNEHRYPIFTRWKFSPFLKGHMLCVDDPMYHFHPAYPNIALANWYYGTPEKSYLVVMSKLIRKVIDQLGIKPEDVTFIGSSSGGYAALYSANLLDRSAAIAMNPQFVPYYWQTKLIAPKFLEWGIDLGDFEDPFERKRIKLTNPTSRFFISINVKSNADYKEQMGAFIEDHPWLKPKLGISQSDNITMWLLSANYNNNHLVFPNEIGLLFADQILQQQLNGYDANELTYMSQLMNEVIREKHELFDRAEMYRRADGFVLKTNPANYHKEPDNHVMMHSSGKIHFTFDRNVFEEHLINNKTMLTTLSVRPSVGKYAVIPLDGKLDKNKKYLFKLRFKILTDSGDYNFHIKQSLNTKYQEIYSHKVNIRDAGKWIEKEIEFMPKAEIFDEFMIGAAQLKGEDAYIVFDKIIITEKT